MAKLIATGVVVGLDLNIGDERTGHDRERILLLGHLLASLRSSRAAPATRSVSCLRVCAMPVMRVGPSSNGAIAGQGEKGVGKRN